MNAGGLCIDCYMDIYRDHPKAKARHAELERARRKRNPDIYKAQERKRAQTPKRKAWKETYIRAYYVKHADALKAYQVQWKRENPDMVAEFAHRYRARKCANTVTPLSKADWKAILESQYHLCYYCEIVLDKDNKAVADHWMPISRGGPHCKENIVASCRSCNARKTDKTGEEFDLLLMREEWAMMEKLFQGVGQ